MMVSSKRIVGGALLGLVFTVTSAVGDVKPGDVINRQNAAQIKDLVTPSIEWVLSRGATIEIAEYKQVGWPKLYKEATEKYSGQVKLSGDGMTLEGHVAGMPFPAIDPNDPKAALKVMWNYEYRPYPGTDDFVEYDFPSMSMDIAGQGGATVDRVFQIGDSRRLYYNARVAVDPKPELPNPKGYRFQDLIGPLLAPYDIKGLGALTYRHVNPTQQDNTFLYMPSLRRIRRLSTAQRSSALFGQDADPDSFWGYSGHIAWMDWKFLGEKEMLGVLHAEKVPMPQCPAPADFMFCDKWEKRKVYAIEGISKLPQYAYSKRVIFLDKESYIVTYSDIYDTRGELWKVWIDHYVMSKQLKPGAPQYDEERAFYTGFVMIDMQLNHATFSPHPGKETASDGWFFNAGAQSATAGTPEGSVPDAFTIAKLVARGQ
ncbi:MAG: DUF1329 domain-containing protein [Candidatus Binatia bacterium]